MVNLKHIEFLDKVFVRRPYFEASAYKVERLRDVLKTNVFKNAIWLASTEFYNELARKDFDFDLMTKREQISALKYYNRMCFRATPFGAFSAFGLANWVKDNNKRKKLPDDLDLYLLPSVQQEIDDLLAPLTGDLLIAINPTLYQLSSGWRYSRWEEDKKGKLSFSVYLLQYDHADELLLGHFKEKSLQLKELVDFLVDLTDCSQEEAVAHVEGLINEQVLISANALTLLTNQSAIKQWSVPFNSELKLPEFIADNTSGLSSYKDGKALYAGLEIHNPIGLSDHWQHDILEALRVLDLLAPIPPKNNLDKFLEAFEHKFGERSVPLLEALDPDLGIAFDDAQQSGDHELLKGLEFDQQPIKNDQLTWTPVHHMLMNAWLQNAKRTEWEPVVLSNGDVAGLPGNDLPFPPSTSVFCSLAGDKVIFQNIGGATANALTGRFSTFSEDFDAFNKATAKQESEANPDILFAEIEQVSHRKIDNINRRRQVYDQVIPLNVFPREGAILPKDIDLLIRGGEIVLIHRPSGKRIIPRLPTAFNYHHNEMPLFRFLCALQYKSIRANFDFDPEKVFPGLNFYPRIEYGKCVISLARWYLSEAEVSSLVQQPLSISRLHLLCRERGIPARISVGVGDQQLIFDLSNDEEALFFLETLSDHAKVVVTEYIASNTGLMKGEGHYNSQFVISLRNTQPVYQSLPIATKTDTIIRDFQPGSEWIYMKVYVDIPMILTPLRQSKVTPLS